MISSRTPEGEPNLCQVCAAEIRLEPSRPPGDAPCPNCGTLLWFSGRRISLYVCPHCKTRIPFGTETEAPARSCPGCQAPLSIPRQYQRLPWIDFVCPACSCRLQLPRQWAGTRGLCPKCQSVIDVCPNAPPPKEGSNERSATNRSRLQRIGMSLRRCVANLKGA
jgi:hypothetical protein